MIIGSYGSYGFFGWLHVFFSFLLTKIFFYRSRLIRYPFYFRGCKYFELGVNMTSGVGLRIDCFKLLGRKPILVFGDNVQVNDYVHIGCVDKIIIGDNVLIASKVFITDHNHGDFLDNAEIETPPSQRKISSKPVVIMKNVWIGEHVCVLPGVTIGESSIVGAGSIVTKDVPPYSIVVGNPARVIKEYSFESGGWEAV